MDRTHLCRDLPSLPPQTEITVAGWVDARRDHGGIVFLDLRDRSGKVQLVCTPQQGAEIRSEWVITAQGHLAKRASTHVNPSLATGELEICVDTLQILSRATPLPTQGDSEQALRYRYLTFRQQRNKLLFRHSLSQAIRNYLSKEEFTEVQTPILGKSTPEGARDFLIPSRLQLGHCYALPQSPQLFKQLLMIGGLERYFQIAPCFRDEDLRADRQPEFTQLDIEVSFLQPVALQKIIEGLLVELFQSLLSVKLATPFPRISLKEALQGFGSDTPDLRWGMAAKEISELIEKSSCLALQGELAKGGKCLGLRVRGGGDLSRSFLAKLTKAAQDASLGGLVAIRCTPTENVCNISNAFSPQLLADIVESCQGKVDDLILIAAGPEQTVHSAFRTLRKIIGKHLGLETPFAFVWIDGFSLFEDGESIHHPFTAPHPADLDNLEKARALSYDLVLNGTEVGGGSQRIDDPELQRKVFSLLGLSEEDIETHFGFFLEALRYGTPPHVGLAIGLDRLMMHMLGLESIREVIPFPKTQRGSDLVTDAPAKPSSVQLAELGLRGQLAKH